MYSAAARSITGPSWLIDWSPLTLLLLLYNGEYDDKDNNEDENDDDGDDEDDDVDAARNWGWKGWGLNDTDDCIDVCWV